MYLIISLYICEELFGRVGTRGYKSIYMFIFLSMKLRENGWWITELDSSHFVAKVSEDYDTNIRIHSE